MKVEVIDWSNAPDDAQYRQDGRWYKIENNRVFTRRLTDENAEWVESAWTVEDDLDNHPDFIKRPVSTPAETHLIEPKPPLGLTPKSIWEEQMQHQRRQDIHTAMQRYIEAGKEIPNDWLEELLELNNAIGIIKAQEVLATAKQNIKEEMDVEQPDNNNEGWIEWGKEEEPNISDYATVEKVYSDGDTKTGCNSDYKWFGSAGWDGKPYVVVRYRSINEETE